jgi:hypothetical protein
MRMLMLQRLVPHGYRWKTREIGVRQGANHSQVRPRTAE